MEPIYDIVPMPTDREGSEPGMEFDAREELELAGRWNRFLRDVFDLMFEHDTDEERLSTVLDWAAQLRREQNLDWSEALDAAMIAYYG
jgi:hypothetical protein